MNSSSYNTTFDSTLGEFSHWKLTTAIILVSRLLFSVPITLLINTSIVVTILKTKSLRRPLNLIHLSLLSVNCLILIPDIILTSTFIPTALRYCECSAISSSIYFLMEILYFAFQPLNFASLGVFQLLIVNGKKQFVSYKSVAASIAICTALTAIVMLEGVTIINTSGATYVCRNICPQDMPQMFWGSTVAFIIHGFFCYLPSLFVVVLCTIWSCIVFEKNDTSGNDQLINRKIISLPIVIPLFLIIPTFALLRAIEQLIESSGSSDYPYWAIFARFLSFQIYEIMARIVYPFLLLLMNRPIGQNWKEMMFKKCTCTTHNQVSPSTSE